MRATRRGRPNTGKEEKRQTQDQERRGEADPIPGEKRRGRPNTRTDEKRHFEQPEIRGERRKGSGNNTETGNSSKQG